MFCIFTSFKVFFFNTFTCFKNVLHKTKEVFVENIKLLVELYSDCLGYTYTQKENGVLKIVSMPSFYSKSFLLNLKEKISHNVYQIGKK